jgi:hypothetical protein
MTLSPAQCAIQVFGGVRATARVAGLSPSSVSRWQISKEDRGTGGMVPTSVQRKLLEAAKERQLTLSADDLILGREVGDG